VESLRTGDAASWKSAGQAKAESSSSLSPAEVKASALAGVAAGWPERVAAIEEGFQLLSASAGGAQKKGAHAEL